MISSRRIGETGTTRHEDGMCGAGPGQDVQGLEREPAVGAHVVQGHGGPKGQMRRRDPMPSGVVMVMTPAEAWTI
jgi:hypothetical protein